VLPFCSKCWLIWAPGQACLQFVNVKDFVKQLSLYPHHMQSLRTWPTFSWYILCVWRSRSCLLPTQTSEVTVHLCASQPDPDTDESYDVVRASSDNDNRLGELSRVAWKRFPPSSLFFVPRVECENPNRSSVGPIIRLYHLKPGEPYLDIYFRSNAEYFLSLFSTFFLSCLCVARLQTQACSHVFLSYIIFS